MGDTLILTESKNKKPKNQKNPKKKMGETPKKQIIPAGTKMKN
jgi:hypothetical protein